LEGRCGGARCVLAGVFDTGLRAFAGRVSSVLRKDLGVGQPALGPRAGRTSFAGKAVSAVFTRFEVEQHRTTMLSSTNAMTG
jgi:hypothetical protein